MAKRSQTKQRVLESSYLLRMFNLSFAVFSMFPLTVLFYIMFRFGKKGSSVLLVPKEDLRWLIFALGATSLILFLAMKNIMAKIVLLNYNLKKSLMGKADKEFMLDLAKQDGEIAELAKTFANIVGKLETNVENLKQTKKTLYNVLSKVGKAIASMENFDSFIHLILETTMDSLRAASGAIFSLAGDDVELVASIGMGHITQKDTFDTISSLVEGVIKERKLVVVPFSEEEKDLKGFEARPLMQMPLVCRDTVWGVICLNGRKDGGNFSEDEVKILSNLSYQIAISFENAALNKDIERTYFETMAALALAVEAKDHYSRGHSERVGNYAAKIGKVMGVPENDIRTLKDASRLHDIGKIGIDDNILKKSTSLSQDEWEVMRRHPEIGESIVRPLKTFQHLLEPIKNHHEFLDGSGYPQGLTGEDIPLITRILTVADIYDAMTSDRAYRKALTDEEAREEFQTMIEGKKIDKQVVNTLFRLLEERKL